MSAWLINGSTPESLGFSVVGGVFQSGSASSVSLRAERDFDAAELEEYGDDVTITLDGNPFFKGRIRQVAKSGIASNESHDYAVEDAWADMERTTYQETWQTATGAALVPRVFLGVAPNGDARTLGEQIEAAIDFAAASGISIQKGSIPAGLQLWPEEVDGISIAEVIRTSLRFHPDWIPWIDHSTTPPTFNVTPAATASTLTIPVAECSDLTVTEIEDRLPDVVRIVYVTASQVEVEGEAQISRTIAVDKFPASGADSGPGVLSVSVDLQGVKASIQKQQVETRKIPTDQAELKIWLKEKFPALADVPEAAFNVTVPTRTVIPDVPEVDLPPPINPNAVRLRGDTTADLPRELVRGVIHEWIRRKVGTVRVDFDIEPSETATVDQADLIARIPTAVSVTATNATTKTYRGLASWEDAENIPVGVAEAYHDTIRSGARFEGSISTPDAALAGWHGRKLRLTDGATAWATMDAPIHAIRWDAHTMAASVSFGPTPTYAFQDFMEYLKLLRRRPVTWISAAERSGEEIGSATSASANGDIVGPFDAPRDVPEFTGGGETPARGAWNLTVAQDESENWQWKVSSDRSTLTDGTNGDALDLTPASTLWAAGAVKFDDPTTISATAWIVLEIGIDAEDDHDIEDLTFSATATADDAREILVTGTPPAQTKLRLLVGKIVFADGVPTAIQGEDRPQVIDWAFFDGVEVKAFGNPQLAPESLT